MLTLRERVHEIIFEADTPLGKLFDVALIVGIVLSVIAVMLDSVESVRTQYGAALSWLEWSFTIGFSIEYLVRLWCVPRPWRYATSFFGVIDLLAIIPTYASLVFPGGQYLLVIRVLRVLRVFRVLKLVQYLGEANALRVAIQESRRKILIFMLTLLMLDIIMGALMYLIEGAEGGFTSIPRSVYWAIVTMTTVGYGDISPVTNLGQGIAAMMMIVGYSIIAVPTGIVGVEIAHAMNKGASRRRCESCEAGEHDRDASHCKYCGTELP